MSTGLQQEIKRSRPRSPQIVSLGLSAGRELAGYGYRYGSSEDEGFEQLLIDRTEIPQSDLNIDEKRRSNVFTWNGQFSPQFVETILHRYASPGCMIIDPFSGSGTVLYEAARKGMSAMGVELNASAYFMSKTYEIANLSYEERDELLEQISKAVRSICAESEILAALKQEIDEHLGSAYANLLSALIVLMDVYQNEVTFDLLYTKWNNLKGIVYNLPCTDQSISVVHGDARHLPFAEDSAELLLTSPPYINVFNYHQKYRRSVEVLGYDVLSIAKSEIGANRKFRSNRFLTVVQYCIDMALSMKEAMKVCKHGARMIYVVGRESTVLGYSFCNSALIYDIATKILGLTPALRQERFFKNRFGQTIYEDILHFFNTKKLQEDVEAIVKAARCVATEALQAKYSSNPGDKNANLILDAVYGASMVKPSENKL